MDAICDGDRNTRYFHILTVIRRRRNQIETLLDNDSTWASDSSHVQELISHYWENLFQEEAVSCRNNIMPWNYFPSINVDDMEKITRPFSVCEVVVALTYIKPYKAPGPDGFQPIFYQQF